MNGICLAGHLSSLSGALSCNGSCIFSKAVVSNNVNMVDEAGYIQRPFIND